MNRFFFWSSWLFTTYSHVTCFVFVSNCDCKIVCLSEKGKIIMKTISHCKSLKNYWLQISLKIDCEEEKKMEKLTNNTNTTTANKSFFKVIES